MGICITSFAIQIQIGAKLFESEDSPANHQQVCSARCTREGVTLSGQAAAGGKKLLRSLDAENATVRQTVKQMPAGGIEAAAIRNGSGCRSLLLESLRGVISVD